MEVLRLAISKRNIECIKNNLVDVIGDNADYEARFVFDGEWAGKIKTARFVNPRTNRYKDVVLENDTCIIPVEMLKKGFLNIGVFSDVMTTKPCEVLVRESIKEKTGSVQPPTDDVYSQLIELIESGMLKGNKGDPGDDGAGIVSIVYAYTDTQGGNVYTVTLTNDSTYEITAPQGPTGSGGGTVDHRVLEYRDAEDQHPITAITGLRTELNSILDGKQNKISDLEDIREGAEAGATAIQPEDLPDYPDTEEAGELSIDDEPKEDSDNLITSGAVYDAIEPILTEISGINTLVGSGVV